jgi:hypothetical protein
LGSV